MRDRARQERREFVRAPLRADVELSIVEAGEYESVRDSVHEAGSFFAGPGRLSQNQAVQYEGDSAFNADLIRFLVQMDEKLDTALRLLSRLLGDESSRHGTDTGNAGPFMGRGMEISGAGMSVLCDRVIDPGRIVKIRFMLSRFPVVPLQVFGEVLRSDRAQTEGAKAYKVVVKFIDVEEEERDKIIAYTFQMQRNAIRRVKRGNNV